jgi:PKD repeat protein
MKRAHFTLLSSSLLVVALCGAGASSASAANNAEIIASHLPSSLAPGEQFEAWVQVRNSGTTTWRNNSGYQFGLGAVDDSDPFTTTTRLLFDSEVDVEPGGTHVFEFTLVGRGGCGGVPLTTDWRMVQDLPTNEATWFGAVAQADVTVVNDCTYRCNAHVVDGYGRPLQGIHVTLKTFDVGGLNPIDVVHGYTDAQGNTTVRSAAVEPPAGIVRCEVPRGDLPREAIHALRQVHDVHGVDPTSTAFPMELQPIVAPAATASTSVPGLKTGAFQGSGEARLYLSKDNVYDKVVVIPQGMDFLEQDPEKRQTADRLWFQFMDILVPLRQMGYDVWLFRPWKTGENIHEQAAEFAQAIKHAALVYNGGPPSHRVIVAGYSLGGVVSRLATARWQADPGWRSLLQLPETLPISMVAFGDAPLRGARAPVDLMSFLWDQDKQGSFNLDTCAAQQLLQESCSSPGACGSDNFDNFYARGGGQRFRRGQASVCDAYTPTDCMCDAGPPVFTIGGDGFADVRTVAFAAGAWQPENRCYGGDKDRNSKSMDLCPHDAGGDGASVPQPGEVYANLWTENCPFMDKAFSVSAEDLVAGSRFAFPLEGYSGDDPPGDIFIFPHWIVGPLTEFLGVCAGRWRMTQNFAPTFIPTRSALSADDENSVPFGPGNWTNGSYHASHDRPEGRLIGWLFDRFDEATTNKLPVASANIQPTATNREYRFDGSASSDPDGTIVSYRWAFGDGAQASGPQVTHRYPAPGSYAVRLTVTDNEGGVGNWTGSVDVPQDTIGALDGVDPFGAFGWTCNKNDFAAALTIHIYLDAPAGARGRLVGTTVATMAREPAVGAQCGGNPNHGYYFAFPASVRDGQAHAVYAYGVFGGGVLLGGSPRDVTFPRPIGSLDLVDGIRALGWTCDSDDYAVSLQVHLYLDGPAGGGGRFVGVTTAALAQAPAVAAACGGNANHGFQFDFPPDIRDGLSHSVYAYAIDHMGVYNSLLGGSPLTAVLPVPSYTLTVTKAGIGSGTLIATVPSQPSQPSVICAAGCDTLSASFPYGTTVRLAMAPDVGSTFSGWANACTGTQSTCDVVVNGPKAVMATFVPPAASAPLQYFPLATPCRVLDTRTTNVPLQHGATRVVQVTGSCVPAAAQAVAATVTAVGPSSAGHLRMNGNAVTTAAVTVFPRAGDAWAGSTVSSLSSSGQANVMAALADGGSTHLVIDATGYFAAPAAGGQNFTPRDTPRRLVDTSLAAGVVTTFGSGAASFTPATPSALAVSVAAVAPPAAGNLVLYPGGGGSGGTATLNYSAGSLIYNGTIVRLGSTPDADLAARSVQGHHVVIDVNGAFHAPTPGSLQYHRIEPCRVVDSRVSGGKLAAGERRSFQVRGMCGAIPAAARAVAANFSAVEPEADGNLAFAPAGAAATAGHLLYKAHEQIGSGALLPLSDSARLGNDLTVSTPTATHVLVDITGYFAAEP